MPLVKPWTPAQIALLGKVPDPEIARRTGRNYQAVHFMRRKLGISNSAGLLHPWTKAEDRLLGTASDPEIARKLNRSLASVFTRDAIWGLILAIPIIVFGQREKITCWAGMLMRKSRNV